MVAGHVLGGARADTLTVVRHNPLYQVVPPLPPTVTVHDPTVVRELYADLLSLPPMPRGPISCPDDSGVTYTLTFLEHATAVLTADADASGCQAVHLSGGSVLWSVPQHGGGAFWALLGRILGLSQEHLRG